MKNAVIEKIVCEFFEILRTVKIFEELLALMQSEVIFLDFLGF